MINEIIKYINVPYWKNHLKTHKYKYPESFNLINKRGGVLHPAQDEWEIKELLEILNLKKPQTILEIGTGKGGTLFLFCSIATDNAKICSIDLKVHPYGNGYPFFMKDLIKSYARENQELFLLNLDSHSEETKQLIQREIFPEGIDFLFIDGDHTYDGVKRDFQLYLPLVKKQGLIAIHDINSDTGVKTFWNEIRDYFIFKEIKVLNKSYGIGVIEK